MKELYTAFIKFQSEFKGLKPDANNPFFKSNYITLDGILETVRPLLAKNGLAVIQNAFSSEGNMCCKTILIHESGQSLESETMCMKPVKDDPQQRGSVVTYMKRYQLGAMLGICESLDDDANLATHGKSQPAKPAQTVYSQVGTAKNLAKSKGVDEARICASYKVEKLEQLTPQQIAEVIKRLEKTEAKTA